ncbi:MAG TPA: bifunctional anthranilate synthase component II/anthranilate phosphoribosyltransferase [Spirochaetota bacterium]|nr:bifunctional anthranilate synthase component II/anthranilate phosphoribosyltransferase [Spirochaetota bacterium]
MVLMIDNYDSFTYNIVQYLMKMGEDVTVHRNDAITVDEARALEFDHLVISPGPGNPDSAGISLDLIRDSAGKKPVLGVCLGHQAIGQAFGAKIISAKKIMHGKADMIHHDGKTLFKGLPNPLRVIRYHSLAIDEKSLPPEFEVSARSSDGEVMAIRHRKYRVEGVQFHPESIGSEEGMKLLANFFSGEQEQLPVKTLLKKVAVRQNLSTQEAERMIDGITSGEMTPSQIGAFLTALAMKGETVDEISGFVKALRSKALPVPVKKDCVDTCGTGGDSSGTFNISTAASFVACGAGAVIAKHGNRSITSKSGSADVLEALGIAIDMPGDKAAEAIDKCGMAFLFAQKYHPAFKNIGGPRRELGFRTVFNVLGPLLNPAGAKRQVMGVFDGALTETIARVLERVGAERAFVVHGSDGLDEITLTGPTKITELRDGWIRTYQFDPREYGFELCSGAELKGGASQENADIVIRILQGEKGAKRDVVVLNAAAAIIAAGIAEDFPSAIARAKKSIDSGEANKAYEKLRKFSVVKRDWE